MRTYDEDLEKFSGEITITDEDSLEKTRKVDMPRIWNGYLCKNNRPVMLCEESNIKEEQEKDLSEEEELDDSKEKIISSILSRGEI